MHLSLQTTICFANQPLEHGEILLTGEILADPGVVFVVAQSKGVLLDVDSRAKLLLLLWRSVAVAQARESFLPVSSRGILSTLLERGAIVLRRLQCIRGKAFSIGLWCACLLL